MAILQFKKAILLVGALVISTILSSCIFNDNPEDLDTPTAPLNVSAIAGNSEALVSWSSPEDLGVSAFAGYRVTAVQDTGKHCVTQTSLFCTVTGLTNGTPYTFVVAAANLVGVGPTSLPSAPVIPQAVFTVPSAPKSASAVAGDGTATVTWSPPSLTGGSEITGYAVVSEQGIAFFCETNGALSCTVTGLTNGTSYTFVVTASNATGTSPGSIPTSPVTPQAIPSAPAAVSDVTVFVGDGAATVSWNSPASNAGSTVTVRAVEDTSKHCQTSTVNSCVVTGLTNGTSYTFVVTVTNGVGSTPASPPTSPVTPQPGPAVPGAPTAVTAVAGNALATVSWNSPASNGGTAITGYMVTADQDTNKRCQTSGTLTCQVNGLVNGTSYTFRVVATNAVGKGPASAPSVAVTPTAPAVLPGTSWTTRTSGSSSVLHAVVWNGSQLVVVGQNGAALTSPDGITWTSRGMGVTTAFTGVIWTGNLFVAAGAGGAIRTSTDGITWTARSTGTTNTLYNLASSGSVITAAGTNGAIVTSVDGGITWTVQTSGTTTVLYNVEWNGSLFATVGASGVIRTSTDGVTWTARTSNATATFYGTTWTGSKLVAVGSSGTVRTSADGLTWSTVTTGSTATFYAATQANGRLLVSGSGGTVVASDDGATASVLTTGTTATLNGVTWTGSRAVAVGAGGTIITSP